MCHFFVPAPHCRLSFSFFFFFNDTATTEIYTLSLHDALPIWPVEDPPGDRGVRAAAPGAGTAHRSGGGRVHGSVGSARRGRRDRGVPSVHDDARGREAEIGRASCRERV